MTPGMLPLPLFLPLPLRERARGEGACSPVVIPNVSNAVIPDVSNVVIPDVTNRESKAKVRNIHRVSNFVGLPGQRRANDCGDSDGFPLETCGDDKRGGRRDGQKGTVGRMAGVGGKGGMWQAWLWRTVALMDFHDSLYRIDRFPTSIAVYLLSSVHGHRDTS